LDTGLVGFRAPADASSEDGIEFVTVAKPTQVTKYTPSAKKQIQMDISLPSRPDKGGTDGKLIQLKGQS